MRASIKSLVVIVAAFCWSPTFVSAAGNFEEIDLGAQGHTLLVKIKRVDEAITVSKNGSDLNQDTALNCYKLQSELRRKFDLEGAANLYVDRERFLSTMNAYVQRVGESAARRQLAELNIDSGTYLALVQYKDFDLMFIRIKASDKVPGMFATKKVAGKYFGVSQPDAEIATIYRAAVYEKKLFE